MVTDRFQKRGSADVPYRQQGDFIIEIHKSLHDHFSCARTSAFLRRAPGLVNIGFRPDDALSMPGRAHDGLDDARHSDFGNGFAVFLFRCGEPVSGSRQSEFFRCETADSFAVHGEIRRAGVGDDMVSLFFKFQELGCGDRFDLRHNISRFFLFDNGAERIRVKHIDDMTAMGDLHRRSICITVRGDHFGTEPLEFDRHFFSKFARSEQKNLDSA